MKHERPVRIGDSDSGSGHSGDLVGELDRIRFSERIAHLDRRTRIQRKLIDKLARREDMAPFAELQAILLALEEIEERNLVLEGVINTVRAQVADDAGSVGVLAPMPQKEAGKDRASGAPAHLINEGRLEAERLRAQGSFKAARRVLRSVRCRKALAGSGMQMMAVSRYRIIRALFSFYRYRGTP